MGVGFFLDFDQEKDLIFDLRSTSFNDEEVDQHVKASGNLIIVTTKTEASIVWYKVRLKMPFIWV